jgi:very-short-patch-repair endonuclease
LGFTSGAIEHAARFGRLHRLYRGVYAVGHAHVTREGRYLAAVLACGPQAVLSHWSAALHWELLRTPRWLIDVSVVGHRRGGKGVRTHRLRELHPADRTRHDRIPITSVPRTLLDLATVADERTLRRAVNEADRAGKLNRAALAHSFERHRGRHGVPALTAVLAAVDPATHRTRSDLEAVFLALCHRYKLPAPVVNTKVAGYEVDMHWPGTGLIVELDSYEYHRTPAEFAADRRRDAHLKTLGYTVIRVADSWLDTDPAGVAATIRKLLSTT